MKKIAVVILLASSMAYSQTNTFPTTGNVGIGTLSPSSRLSVGAQINNRIISLYDASSDWYGFGIQSYQLRLQVGNPSARFSFMGGDMNEVFTIKGTGEVGIGNISPSFKLDIEGGQRVKNSSVAFGSYTTFRVQGPDYTNGLEIDFFGNSNISTDLNWTYGGGAGSAAIINVNAKPLTFGTSNVGRMIIDATGNVGIGTFTPDAKLAVKGQIHAQEVKVDLQGSIAPPDYVFASNYQLPTLDYIKTYIDQNKHLPEVPSAKEMETNGVNLGEMNMLLLRKIEELTLYIIDQNKQIAELKERSVSPDSSGKKIEELTLYMIELKKRDEAQQLEIEHLKNKK